MDSEQFARRLPELFADFPRSPHPLDRRFLPILAEVERARPREQPRPPEPRRLPPRPGRELRRGRLLQGPQPDRRDAGERRRLRRDRRLLDGGRRPRAAREEPPAPRPGRPHDPRGRRLRAPARRGARRPAASASTTTTPRTTTGRSWTPSGSSSRHLAEGALLIVDDTDWKQVRGRCATTGGASPARVSWSRSPARTAASPGGGRACRSSAGASARGWPRGHPRTG